MARDAITLTQITEAGIAPPAQVTAVAANDLEVTVTEGDIVFIEIENTDGSSHDVVIETGLTVAGYALADLTVTVGAGAKKLVKIPLDSRNVFQQTDGKLYIDTSSGDTFLKFRAYKL